MDHEWALTPQGSGAHDGLGLERLRDGSAQVRSQERRLTSWSIASLMASLSLWLAERILGLTRRASSRRETRNEIETLTRKRLPRSISAICLAVRSVDGDRYRGGK